VWHCLYAGSYNPASHQQAGAELWGLFFSAVLIDIIFQTHKHGHCAWCTGLYMLAGLCMLPPGRHAREHVCRIVCMQVTRWAQHTGLRDLASEAQQCLVNRKESFIPNRLAATMPEIKEVGTCQRSRLPWSKPRKFKLSCLVFEEFLQDQHAKSENDTVFDKKECAYAVIDVKGLIRVYWYIHVQAPVNELLV
jgi:hypothetical protein